MAEFILAVCSKSANAKNLIPQSFSGYMYHTQVGSLTLLTIDEPYSWVYEYTLILISYTILELYRDY